MFQDTCIGKECESKLNSVDFHPNLLNLTLWFKEIQTKQCVFPPIPE